MLHFAPEFEGQERLLIPLANRLPTCQSGIWQAIVTPACDHASMSGRQAIIETPITLTEAAELMGVSLRSVRRFVKPGSVPRLDT